MKGRKKDEGEREERKKSGDGGERRRKVLSN